MKKNIFLIIQALLGFFTLSQQVNGMLPAGKAPAKAPRVSFVSISTPLGPQTPPSSPSKAPAKISPSRASAFHANAFSDATSSGSGSAETLSKSSWTSAKSSELLSGKFWQGGDNSSSKSSESRRSSTSSDFSFSSQDSEVLLALENGKFKAPQAKERISSPESAETLLKEMLKTGYCGGEKLTILQFILSCVPEGARKETIAKLKEMVLHAELEGQRTEGHDTSHPDTRAAVQAILGKKGATVDLLKINEFTNRCATPTTQLLKVISADIFPIISIRHVFTKEDENGGYHHECDTYRTIQPEIVNLETKVYGGFWLKRGQFRKFSSFFPRSWSREQVCQSIQNAYGNQMFSAVLSEENGTKKRILGLDKQNNIVVEILELDGTHVNGYPVIHFIDLSEKKDSSWTIEIDETKFTYKDIINAAHERMTITGETPRYSGLYKNVLCHVIDISEVISHWLGITVDQDKKSMPDEDNFIKSILVAVPAAEFSSTSKN